MMKHLEKHNVLTSLNHGFKSGYSCEKQFVATIHDMLQLFHTDLFLWRSLLWGTVSKALEKSRIPMSTCFPWSNDCSMSCRQGNAFQCQKVLHSKHEEKEPPLLYIKQPNPGTSTIKSLHKTTNSRRLQMEETYKQHL
jgi:hypothetical protein